MVSIEVYTNPDAFEPRDIARLYLESSQALGYDAGYSPEYQMILGSQWITSTTLFQLPFYDFNYILGSINSLSPVSYTHLWPIRLCPSPSENPFLFPARCFGGFSGSSAGEEMCIRDRQFIWDSHGANRAPRRLADRKTRSCTGEYVSVKRNAGAASMPGTAASCLSPFDRRESQRISMASPKEKNR